jgi:hypothetical protein
MRTRWMVGAMVVAELLLAVYARSQESRSIRSASYDVPPAPTDWCPPASAMSCAVKPAKAESEPAKLENLADLFKSMDKIRLQKAKLKEQEKQILARMEKIIQEQQKSLDANRAKLAKRKQDWGYSSGGCGSMKDPEPDIESKDQINALPHPGKKIKTVRVPIFKNKTCWVVTPLPGMEKNLTQEVVRAIQARTPYRVVGANEPADTEIQGSIVGFTKAIINYNQIYEPRESEVTLVCRVNWTDLHTGKPITRPGCKAFDPALPAPLSPVGVVSPTQVFKQTPVAANPTPATDEVRNVPQPANNLSTPGTLGTIAAAPLPGAPGGVADQGGVVLRSVTYFRVELRQSTATAADDAYKNMGIKITELMEMPW